LRLPCRPVNLRAPDTTDLQVRMTSDTPRHDEEWDAGDLGCGELVLLLRFRLNAMLPGQVMRLRATDAGAIHDIPAWCRMTGEQLLQQDPSSHVFWIRRMAR